MSQRDILAAAARRFADNPTDPNLVDLFNAVMELPFAEMPAAYLERPLTFNPVLARISEADLGPVPSTITIAGAGGDACRIIASADSLGNRSVIAFPDEPAFLCKVCGARPDEDGWIEHGRGCYVLSADGGGSEYVGTRSTETP